jgi:hypothetical protein
MGWHHSPLHMLIKPEDRLQERLLLGIGHQLVRQVATHSESVRDSRVQIDLVRNLDGLQDDFGLVALLRRKLPVSFCRSSARQRPWTLTYRLRQC